MGKKTVLFLGIVFLFIIMVSCSQVKKETKQETSSSSSSSLSGLESKATALENISSTQISKNFKTKVPDSFNFSRLKKISSVNEIKDIDEISGIDYEMVYSYKNKDMKDFVEVYKVRCTADTGQANFIIKDIKTGTENSMLLDSSGIGFSDQNGNNKSYYTYEKLKYSDLPESAANTLKTTMQNKKYDFKNFKKSLMDNSLKSLYNDALKEIKKNLVKDKSNEKPEDLLTKDSFLMQVFATNNIINTGNGIYKITTEENSVVLTQTYNDNSGVITDGIASINNINIYDFTTLYETTGNITVPKKIIQHLYYNGYDGYSEIDYRSMEWYKDTFSPEL